MTQQSAFSRAVRLVLDEVRSGAQAILVDTFVGMYLYGSLANGDFDDESDLDYVVVTETVLDDRQFSALDTMHQRIASMNVWWATQLEGSYIPRDALRKYNPVRALHVHIDRGRGERLHRMKMESDALSRAWWGGWVILRENLRERGITLTGPAPQTLIDPVEPDDLRQAAIAILPGWTQQILDNPGEISKRGYQSYTVLTLCRILYTLQNGSVVSKPIAARWARENQDLRWSPLIDRARLGRQHASEKAESKDIDETLDFIRYTLKRSRDLELEGRFQ